MKVQIDGVGFDEADIQITWADAEEVTRFGGSVYLTTITEEAQEEDLQLKYWASEVRQAVDELLGAWIIFAKAQNKGR